MAYTQIPTLGGGGGGGAVDSVNGLTGVVVLTKSNIGLSNVNNTSDANKPVSTATQTALDGKQDTLTGNFNSFAGFDASGLPFSIPGWGFDPDYNGLQETLTIEMNNNGNKPFNSYNSVIDLLQNSPNDSVNIHQTNVTIDPNSTGFDFGTNGSALRVISNYISHIGTSDTGSLDFMVNSGDIGNGTDAISVKGLSGVLSFISVKNNVTVNGPVQGFIWQPACESGALIDTGTYIQAFGDNTNFPIAVPGYSSFQAGPQLGSINNNSNYQGFNINPQIGTFTGNSSFFGVNITPDLGTFGTGGFYGININPQAVDSVVNATGLYINMNSVSASGQKRAIDVTGDVAIDGALSFTGSLTIGQLNSVSSLTLAPSVAPGQPTTNNSLISLINGTANTVDADTLGINTAALINIDPGVAITTSFIGVAALGLPAVMNLGAGATIDNVAGALFALSLGGGTGTADRVYLCRALSIPDGTTTVNALYGYAAQLPFGSVGTTNWGFYESDFQQNYMAHALKIGGTPGSNDTPTNASVGLEVDSTTLAFVLSRMTTAERNALTAVNGMLIYNVTDNKFQGYENGAWANLI